MQEKKINNLVINKVENQQTYEKMKIQGLINNDELYLVGGGTEVTSVNGQTGDINLTAEDVNALSKDTKIPSKTSDLTNDSDYATNTSVDTKLNDKVSKAGDTMTGELNINVSGTNKGLHVNRVLITGNHSNANPNQDTGEIYISRKNATGYSNSIWFQESGVLYITCNKNDSVLIKNIKEPTDDTDAANKKYVDDAIANNTVDISEATTSTPGLMSATDKVKLNGIAENANNYKLPVATSGVLGGVKSGGDFTVNNSTGVVTIKHQSLADYAKTADVNTSLNGKVPTTRKINNKALSADITLSASDISGTVRYDIASQGLTTTQKANARTNIGAGTSSFSGSYNDLTNKPTIPSAITESTVSGWGFTKNTGTYSKPSDGIPKSDLTGAVQTSLDKADTALQSLPNHTHNYAGSSSVGGAANSVKTNLTIKLNGGATEGTNLFTFNGSTAKTINITASNIGAAANSHTHNYAGSSSAGGAATSANKVNSNLIIKLNSGTTEGTNLFTFNGSTAKSIDITPSAIGAATSDHTHSYLPLSGGTLTGNLTGKYITGTWLQTTATSDKAGKFATIDENGWIYYRTASEVATDIGAVTTDTFVAYTEAEIQSMWDNTSV